MIRKMGWNGKPFQDVDDPWADATVFPETLTTLFYWLSYTWADSEY